MTSHFIVCPNSKKILNALSGYSVVPRIQSMDEVEDTARHVHEANAHLHCMIVESNRPLSFSSFPDKLADTPIALYVSGMGNIAHVIRQISNIKQLNIRIYIPLNKKENFSAVRILSSLGVETAVLFDSHVDWEKLDDLMSYAIYGRVAHAEIAPFDYLATRYKRIRRNRFSAVYFDDFRTYLHVNEFAQVALSRQDLLDGNFVCQGVDEINEIENQPLYKKRSISWQKHLLDFDACACCPGWRICLGTYKSPNTGDCKTFFSNFLEAIEFAQEGTEEITMTWQP